MTGKPHTNLCWSPIRDWQRTFVLCPWNLHLNLHLGYFRPPSPPSILYPLSPGWPSSFEIGIFLAGGQLQRILRLYEVVTFISTNSDAISTSVPGPGQWTPHPFAAWIQHLDSSLSREAWRLYFVDGACSGISLSSFLGVWGTLVFRPRTNDVPNLNTCTSEISRWRRLQWPPGLHWLPRRLPNDLVCSSPLFIAQHPSGGSEEVWPSQPELGEALRRGFWKEGTSENKLHRIFFWVTVHVLQLDIKIFCFLIIHPHLC